MTDAKHRFTKAFVSGIRSPAAGRRSYHYDDKGRGLCLVVTPAGTKSFYVLRKVRRRVERVLIGRFPETTIAKARRRAGELNALLDAGMNPNDIRRKERGEPTLDHLFELYLERHAKVHNRRPDKAEYNYQAYLKKPLGKRPLSHITRTLVQQHHLHLGRSKGHRTANIAITLLRTLFNRAIDWELWTGQNPTRGIRKFREQSRARFLLPDEMERFLKVLRAHDNETARDFFLLLLLTGVRKSNAMQMRWRDVNLESGVWQIPDTKTGDAHTLPLAPAAIAILKARAKKHIGPWVFPGTGTTGHIVEMKNAWGRILTDAGITDLWIHDLRRTHGSWMAGSGANLSVIGRALGHKNLATTTVYARLDIDPLRQAINNVSAAMLKHEGDSKATGAPET